MSARTAALALVLSAVVLPAAGQVHRWVDERGVVQYGDRPPAAGASTLRVRLESATAGAGPATPSAPAVAPMRPESAAARVGGSSTTAAQAARPSRPTTASTPPMVDRLLAQQRSAGAAAPTAASPGMQALIAQCKANRGVDCDTPQGMRNLQRENTPITREEQARIAGLRARRATCARVPRSLGC